MDFQEAVGKKVRNTETGEIREVISYEGGPHVTLIKLGKREDGIGFNVDSPISENWQIVEEKNNLSKFIYRNTQHPQNQEVIPLNKSKESIKAFIDWLNSLSVGEFGKLSDNDVISKAKEILGERLI